MVGKSQFRRWCIFCGNGNLSKEHFWPQWARSLLPATISGEYVERIVITEGSRRPVMPPVDRTRQGHVATKKIQAVCGPCNNTWMSRLEQAARPVLTPLILGQPRTITTDDARVMAEWIVLKMMVGEHNQAGEAVSTYALREQFRLRRTIPPNLFIWIGRCGVGGWAAAYWRHNGTVSVGDAPIPKKGTKNMHTVTFGIGNLFIHTLHTTVPEIQIANPFPLLDRRGTQIYPAKDLISWPPPLTLTANEAGIVAGSLHAFFESSAVRWRPFPEDGP